MENKSYNWVLVVVLTIFVFALGGVVTYGIMSQIPGTTIVNKQEKEVTVNENGIADAVEKVYDSVVIVETYKSNKLYATGTGFVYKKDNNKYYLITNNHVIKNGTSVKVEFTNGDVVDTTIVGGDKYADIAILSFESKKDYSIANIGSNDKTRVGDTVFTVGAPIDSATYSWTVTRGILSGKDRLVKVSTADNNNGLADYEMRVLQTDAAINSGNSGGPLCNSNGEVIGVTNMKYTSTGVEGMSFAIPIEDAIDYATRLTNGEDVSRPYLGVSMLDIAQSAYANYYYGVTIPSNIENGVIVVFIEDNSAASKAGLRKGDVITKLNDTEVKTVAEMKYNLYKYKVGDTIKLTVNRDNSIIDVNVTLQKNM